MKAPRLGNGKKAVRTTKIGARAEDKAEHLAARLGLALREHQAAVEQQAATAEILRALSRSTTDAQPVFDAIVRNAHRLCGAAYRILYRYDGRMLHGAADSQARARASPLPRRRLPAP